MADTQNHKRKPKMEPSPTTAPKHRSFFNKLKHPSRFSKPQLLVFVLAFALIGFLLIKALAAAPLIATLQAEQMTPSISSSSVPTKTFGRTTVGSTWTGGLIANDRFIQK